jgi:hypothetical protein
MEVVWNSRVSKRKNGTEMKRFPKDREPHHWRQVVIVLLRKQLCNGLGMVKRLSQVCIVAGQVQK